MRLLRKVLFFASMLMAGCGSPSTSSHGGSASISGSIKNLVSSPFQPKTTVSPAGKSEGGSTSIPDVATINQSGNPSSPSTQNYGYSQVDELTYSRDTQIVTETKQTDGSSVIVTERVPAGSHKKSTTTQNVGQVIGAAQVDTSANLTAKLGSFRIVQWAGIFALLLGAVGFFHPVVRVIIGGKDTAMAVGGAGLVMIFGPTLFVAYEKYFFLAIVVAAVYWFWSRAKHKEGQLDVLKEKAQ